MDKNYCGCKCSCFLVIAGIILGIIAGILSVVGLLTFEAAFYWAAFGIAIGVLGLMLILLTFVSNIKAKYCFYANIKCILTGSLGTILASLTGAVTQITSGIISAGLTVCFFFILVMSVVKLIMCLAKSFLNE